MVGIPQKTPAGLSAGKLSDFIRAEFEKRFPEEEMEKLANSKVSKVPFDAQDNRHTTEYVNGLSAYYLDAPVSGDINLPSRGGIF